MRVDAHHHVWELQVTPLDRVADELDELLTHPHADLLVGIRDMAQDEPDPDWLARPDVVAALREIGRRGLAYDLITLPTQLPAACLRPRTVRSELLTARIRIPGGGRENVMKLRMLAAVAVLVSAAVHLYLWFNVFRHTHIVGPAFMLNAVGGAVIAVLLVTWRHWIPLLLAVGFGASTLGAFIIAVTVGLFGVHEHWTSWEVWTAAAAEIVAIVAAGTVLLQTNPLRSGDRAREVSAGR